MSAKQVVHWGLRQGITQVAFAAGARTKNPVARLAGDARVWADPFGTYARIRRQGPVVPGPLMFATGFLERPSMLVTDGPDHVRYRRLVTKAFTARAVTGLRTRVEEVTAELLDRMEAGGAGADIFADFAQELPVYVITEILGVTAAERARFHAWAKAIVPLFDFGQPYRVFARANAAIREMNAWLPAHLEQLRREPGPNLLSRVIAVSDEEQAAGGPGLDPVELNCIASLLLGAGFETTLNLLGNGSVLLMQHPEQLEFLRAQPSGWGNAVDEILRYESPVQNTVRHPLRHAVVRDVRIPRGRFVLLLLGAANRDPAVFADPDTFDVRRPNAREHLAFSAGPHFCVGAALARLEGEVGLRALFERFPGLTAAGPPHRRPTRNFRGYDRIPVRLRAAAPVAGPPLPAVKPAL
jgi:cytochrome P450